MKITRCLAVLVFAALVGTTPNAVASLDGPTHHELSHSGGHPQGMVMAHEHPQAARVGKGRLRHIRKATARFHNIATAETEGYVLLKDLKGITCIAMPGMGGMGVHFVKPELIKNPAIRAGTPEALVYAPGRDGTLKLAALEYLVDQAAWDSGHAARPRLFPRHPFDLTGSGNRFGLDPFYSQHVWAWKHNSAGRLSMWNPAVHCSRASGRSAASVSWTTPWRTGGVRAV